jgi:hypothetical protein
VFTDDNGNAHEDSIDRLATIGIVTGTGGRSYSPGGHVSRQQMSAFLMRYLADRIDSSEIRTVYPAATPARVTLGAENTITGSASGKTPVRLDQPARLASLYSGADSVQITGDGRFVGFAIVADGTDPHRVMVSGGRLDTSLGEQAVITMNHSFTELESTEDGDWIIPAGDYNLYLIADGTPVSVTLSLDGPTGTTRLAPVTPVASHAARPEARLSPQGTQTGGALSELRGEGLLLQLYATLYSASAFNTLMTCIYDGEAALTATHTPGCPDSSFRGAPIVIQPATGRTVSIGVTSAYHGAGGPVAQGYSYSNAGLNESVDYVAMWLSL